MKIPINVRGSILTGEHPGMSVRVEDDTENTGGYLIYTWCPESDGPNQDNAFDDWVGSENDLEAYFQESGWTILWDHDPAANVQSGS